MHKYSGEQAIYQCTEDCSVTNYRNGYKKTEQHWPSLGSRNLYQGDQKKNPSEDETVHTKPWSDRNDRGRKHCKAGIQKH